MARSLVQREDEHDPLAPTAPFPVTIEHDGVLVVREDLFPGATKARFLGCMFEGADEAVYASPAEGGAQVALATVARQLGKQATIFVARRASPTRARWRPQTWGQTS